TDPLLVLSIDAPLGIGTAEGPFVGALVAGLEAELVARGTLLPDPTEPNPSLADSTNQIDVELSALDAVRRLPDGTAIVPLSSAAVATLVAIPNEIAADYVIKDGLGAPTDLATLAAINTILAGVGIGDALASASGDVTIDVGDMSDRVDLSAFNHNATVKLGDGNDTFIM